MCKIWTGGEPGLKPMQPARVTEVGTFYDNSGAFFPTPHGTALDLSPLENMKSFVISGVSHIFHEVVDMFPKDRCLKYQPILSCFISSFLLPKSLHLSPPPPSLSLLCNFAALSTTFLLHLPISPSPLTNTALCVLPCSSGYPPPFAVTEVTPGAQLSRNCAPG